jgi:chemotaxis protein methyltransferase CheR
MYFTPNVIKEVGARFNDALMENGWLITSPVELNDEYFSNFERILFGKGIFYQKTNKLEKPKKLPIETIPHRPFVTINNRTIKKAEIKNPDRKERINSKKPLAEISSKDAIDPDVYFQKGQYLQCIDRCLRSIDQGNLTNEIFSILVKSYANLGFLTDGEKVIGNILEKHAATPEMYYFYASLFNEQNDFVQTEVNLKKAIYLNHRHVLSHLMLGNVFRYNGKTQLAIKHFETTLELLKKYDDHEIVPDSDGMTAGSIKELTQQIINRL